MSDLPLVCGLRLGLRSGSGRAAVSGALLTTLRVMIDLRALRENPEPFRASQRARGADVDLVDRVIAADETRRQGDPRAWKPWNHPGDWMAAARVR